MAKKIKSMAYLPLSLTQNEQVVLNGYQIEFYGSVLSGVIYGDYFDWYIDDNSFGRGSEIFQDKTSASLEAWNYDGQFSEVIVSDLDAKIQAFDVNVNGNPASEIIAHSNGDILFNSQRINVNGQLALNGEYRVGDKTFTIVNGIITGIQ